METVRSAPAGRRKNLSLRQPARRGAERQQETFDAAYESFYRENVADVYQYALAVLGNSPDAEDVTQQTFLNAYRAFQRGDRPHKPHNWLIKIAHNVCRMRWRQASRRPQEIPLENAREPATLDDDKPSLDEMLKALGELPFNQRAAIVMREVEDRSYAEIADVLTTTVPAVEALLFRARTNLRARRKALGGVLSVAPLPASLSSFFGGGGSSLAAAGGALFGTELVLKIAAVVATGVVAGGLGYKTVDAVATSDPPATHLQGGYQLRAAAPRTFGHLEQPAAARVNAGLERFAHPPHKVAALGKLRRAPMHDSLSGTSLSNDPPAASSQVAAGGFSPPTTVAAAASSVPRVSGAPAPLAAALTPPPVPVDPPPLPVTVPALPVVPAVTVTVPPILK